MAKEKKASKVVKQRNADPDPNRRRIRLRKNFTGIVELLIGDEIIEVEVGITEPSAEVEEHILSRSRDVTLATTAFEGPPKVCIVVRGTDGIKRRVCMPRR